jgi:hypothetical protein
MHAFAQWLRHTPVSEAIWSALWLIRLVQGVHLLAAGVVLVSGMAIALGALGWRFRDESSAEVWRRFAPWLGWSFAVMLVTGIVQTLGDPVREFTATSWWLKMALVLWCMTGTLLLGRRLRSAEPGEITIATRLAASALILAWIAIAMLGRIIAYDLPVWGGLSLRT